ncbi:MAG: permease [Candidatus Njordarchaeia archaeon]|nr:permease [Candidatus Korarchaeota archaeon]
MLTSTDIYIILIIITLSFYGLSYLKKKEETKVALKNAIKLIISGLSILSVAMLLTGVLYVMLSPEIIEIYLSSASFPIGILIATILGFLFPGPRYIIYPIAKFLLDNGASISVALVLIFSQQLIDVPEGMFVEINILGWRFFISRLIISILLCIIAGVLGEFTLTLLG